VKEYLLQQQMQKHQQDVQDYLQKLKKESAVEILDDNLKAKDTTNSETPRIVPPTGATSKPDSK
jgi:hypothetical protein